MHRTKQMSKTVVRNAGQKWISQNYVHASALNRYGANDNRNCSPRNSIQDPSEEARSIQPLSQNLCAVLYCMRLCNEVSV